MIEELRRSARELLMTEGFVTDLDGASAQQTTNVPTLERVLAHMGAPDRGDAGGPSELRDLRGLPWSSIDNVETRDVDQVEMAEPVPGGHRIRVAIADVDAFVPRGSPLDARAAQNTVSVYGAGVVLPMLPEALSEGVTSLLPNQDRLALVAEFVVDADGVSREHAVYRALVRNTAQLDYESVSAWLSRKGPLPPAAHALEEQLRMQHEAAIHLHAQRERLGALEFERRETQLVMRDGDVAGVVEIQRGPARDLIEDFMIAANSVIAGYLEANNVSWVRRMVGAPERWPQIVAIAADHGADLPPTADRRALGAFLRAQRERDPASFAELSLSVLRLLGSGRYVVEHRAEELEAHFALGVDDYTHFTAPNRRFADIATQRIVKAVLAGAPSPYTDAEMEEIAAQSTIMEDRAKSVERKIQARVMKRTAIP
ncbi:MAG: ribonuclease catalytic domain-containing protein [Longimicrobiales bacterium]